LFKDCFQFLSKLKGNKIKLVLELTEREVIPQNETSLRLFRLLKNLGVELAIDDFGTGHSSYSYLHNHYISILKIDRSFIDKISVDAVSGILIDSIIELGHKLSLKMIAEGVETEEQIKYLEEMNVPYAQGYYYNSPQPFKDLIYDLKGI
ncbi:EAL domain-containing protein, partial [Klebsiella pneumoniae]